MERGEGERGKERRKEEREEGGGRKGGGKEKEMRRKYNFNLPVTLIDTLAV